MDVFHQKQFSLIRTIVDKESRTSWSRLYRVPSTYTWRCLGHLVTRDASTQERIYAGIVERAPYQLGSLKPPIQWA